MKKNKKLQFMLLSSFIVLVVFFLSTNVRTRPSFGEDFTKCHDIGDYSISTNTSLDLEIGNGQSFNVEINATGQDVIVQIFPGARNNNDFNATPSITVEDNSEYDLDPEVDKVRVIFTITVPVNDGSYALLIIAREPSSSTPNFAYLEYVIDVGEVSPSGFNFLKFLNEKIFNHLNIYLGLPAILCLLIGYILYEIDDQKYTTTHGKLAAASLILTTINIILIIPQTQVTLISFSNNVLSIDWGHLIHIILGIIGYIAGIIAMLTGLSGIRTKKPGLIALICWSINFIYGISPWGWGFNL